MKEQQIQTRLDVEIQKQLKRFRLDVKLQADGGCLGILGSSGCGKSMTLKSIAGIMTPDEGLISIQKGTEQRILFDKSQKVNIKPQKRRIGYLFQNYALYPNMSVYDNIAFSLSVRKVDKKEIKKKVYDMAKMRVELAALQHAVGTTTIYVTHDQTEAMTLGTRIVVMRDGKMQQVDTPANLYAKPVNRFVAGFIGTPSMNFFEAQVVSWEEAPESVSAGADYVEAMILEVELLGAEKLLFFLLYGKKYVAKIPAEYAARVGEVRRLYFDVTAIHLFDCDSEMRI